MLVQAAHIELLVVAQQLLLAGILLEIRLELLRVEQLVLDLLDARLPDEHARDRAEHVTRSVSKSLDLVHPEAEGLE